MYSFELVKFEQETRKFLKVLWHCKQYFIKWKIGLTNFF